MRLPGPDAHSYGKFLRPNQMFVTFVVSTLAAHQHRRLAKPDGTIDVPLAFARSF